MAAKNTPSVDGRGGILVTFFPGGFLAATLYSWYSRKPYQIVNSRLHRIKRLFLYPQSVMFSGKKEQQG